MKLIKFAVIAFLSVSLMGCPSASVLEKSPFQKNKAEEIQKIQSEIATLGGEPISESKFKTQDKVNQNKYVIALNEQLEQIKEKKKKDKEVAEAKIKKQELESEAKKKKEKKEIDRLAIIQKIKKEIAVFGETPLLDYEIQNEDKYIAALKKQLEEIKKLKKEEEQKIVEQEKNSIPDWFMKPPASTEQVMYARGTAVSNNLQFTIDRATFAALQELARKVNSRAQAKASETINAAGIGDNLNVKTLAKNIASVVTKEVSVGGFDNVDSKMVPLDGGKYRVFTLIKYSVQKVYQNLIKQIDNDKTINASSKQKIKNTRAYKELVLAYKRP